VEQGSEPRGPVRLHRREHVRVEIQRRADPAVPEALLHNVGLHSCLEQERRTRVAEAVTVMRRGYRVRWIIRFCSRLPT
jgi:hypothetical protein